MTHRRLPMHVSPTIGRKTWHVGGSATWRCRPFASRCDRANQLQTTLYKGKFKAPSKVNKRHERDANTWAKRHLHATLAAKHGCCSKRSPNEGGRAKEENNEKQDHYTTHKIIKHIYIYICSIINNTHDSSDGASQVRPSLLPVRVCALSVIGAFLVFVFAAGFTTLPSCMGCEKRMSWPPVLRQFLRLWSRNNS